MSKKKGTNITTCLACGTRCLRDENDHLVPAWKEIMARNEEIRRKKAGELEIYADIGQMIVKWLNGTGLGLELRIGNYDDVKYVDMHDTTMDADVGESRGVDREEVTPEMMAEWLKEVAEEAGGLYGEPEQ